MPKTIDHTLFIDAGHITREPAHFAEPLTVGGRYLATNGYWYCVVRNNGQTFIAPEGYSSAYLEAKQEYTQWYGPTFDEASWERQAAYIARELRLL